MSTEAPLENLIVWFEPCVAHDQELKLKAWQIGLERGAVTVNEFPHIMAAMLVEIKSRPGRLFGDAGTWTWETDGKLSTVDNPLIAANLKAKKLRSLLQKQKAFKKKGQPPFVEALLFCSAPELRNDLKGNARFRVCLRDRDAAGETPARLGIMPSVIPPP